MYTPEFKVEAKQIVIQCLEKNLLQMFLLEFHVKFRAATGIKMMWLLLDKEHPMTNDNPRSITFW